MEQMLNNRKLDFPFCISWANEAWTNAWVNGNKVLIEQRYGGKDEWRRHYQYLSNFFKDDRYIKVKNKPVLIIYRPSVIDRFNEMVSYWKTLAREDGFDGLEIYSQSLILNGDVRKQLEEVISGFIQYQPSMAVHSQNQKENSKIINKIKKYLYKMNVSFEKKYGFELIKFIKRSKHIGKHVRIYNYNNIWNEILSYNYQNNDVLGAFTSWDNTPRHGNGGTVIKGNPSVFEENMKKLLKLAKQRNDKFIFINAWNEWAEGAILEPDNLYKYKYLEAIRKSKMSLKTTNSEK